MYQQTVGFTRPRGEGILGSIRSFLDNLFPFLRNNFEEKKIDLPKDQFIMVFSHELKTPVTSIKGYAQILEKYLTRDETTKIYLSKMNIQINRLSELINGLLDVSRIQSDRLNLEKEDFCIKELTESVIDDFQQITSSHNLHLKESAPVIVNADKYRINQVLVNLLANAIKYSPDASEIFIQIQPVPGGVQVSIEDFGIGIKDEDKEKIFDKFFQVASRMRQSYFGLGLGLYISSEIIKSHGGRMWVESELDKGSKFHFYLPLK